MRIAAMVIGLVVGAVLFLHSLLVAGLSGAADDADAQGAGWAGVLMALLWLVACALVLRAPGAAVWLFGAAVLVGIAGAPVFEWLWVYAAISAGLAVLAVLGRRERREAITREVERDALLRAALSGLPARPAPRGTSDGRQCPRCGRRSPGVANFCQSCGARFAPPVRT